MAVKAKTVLVVDDDQPIRDALEETLQSEGYGVVTAINGQEGIDFLRKIKPNLVLLDMRMPVMDGREFLKEKEADPQLDEIPVFVFSAQTGVNPPNIEATGFIPKPIDLEVLLKILRPYLT